MDILERPEKTHTDNEVMGAPHIRGRGTEFGGEITDINKYLKRGHTEHGAGLLPVTSSDQVTCNGHNVKQSLHCEGEQALAQVAQGSCSFPHQRNSETT